MGHLLTSMINTRHFNRTPTQCKIKFEPDDDRYFALYYINNYPSPYYTIAPYDKKEVTLNCNFIQLCCDTFYLPDIDEDIIIPLYGVYGNYQLIITPKEFILVHTFHSFEIAMIHLAFSTVDYILRLLTTDYKSINTIEEFHGDDLIVSLEDHVTSNIAELEVRRSPLTIQDNRVVRNMI